MEHDDKSIFNSNLSEKSHMISGRSRISHWGAPSHWGGADLQCGHFLAKMYVKTKELDPVGEVHTGSTPPRIRQW